MPELPEVEIIKQSLQKSVINKKINKVLIKNRNLRFRIQRGLEKELNNNKISHISRKSKYLIIHFKNKRFLVIHFGMTGTLHLIKKKKNYQNTNLSFYHSTNLPKKNNHIFFFFDNFKLIYNDPRRFGFIKFFFNKNELLKYFANKGLEPLDSSFNLEYVKKKILNRKKNIKNIFLDQSLISGIGNIYANEILYYSKINPNKKVNKLKDDEIKKIIKFSKYVLKQAIYKGGSSIKDFKNIKGNSGSYQKEFRVYDREGESCSTKNCIGTIKKILISNRSTFLCKYCQK